MQIIFFAKCQQLNLQVAVSIYSYMNKLIKFAETPKYAFFCVDLVYDGINDAECTHILCQLDKQTSQTDRHDLHCSILSSTVLKRDRLVIILRNLELGQA